MSAQKRPTALNAMRKLVSKMIKQFIKGLRPKTIKLDTTLENKVEFAKFLAGRVEIYERNGDKFEIFSVFGDENTPNFMSVVVTGKNADEFKTDIRFYAKNYDDTILPALQGKIYNGVEFKKVYCVYAKLIEIE